MKFLKTALICVALVGSPAFAAEVMRCNNMFMVEPQENGKPILTPSQFTIVILTSTAGKRGWVANMSDGSKRYSENDVEVSNLAPADAEFAKDLAAYVAPHVKWSDVQSIRYGNVGVKANRDDAAGIGIFELIDANGRVLAKLAQVGWGAGVCTI